MNSLPGEVNKPGHPLPAALIETRDRLLYVVFTIAARCDAAPFKLPMEPATSGENSYDNGNRHTRIV